MSAVTAAALVGMGVSLYSGYSQDKEKKAAEERAAGAIGGTGEITKELKARQALVDKTIAAKLAELQGQGPTTAGQQALTQFKFNMGKIGKDIQEEAPMVGEGVTGSRELSRKFQEASGIANINLQDVARKEQQIPAYLGIASQTPAWAGVGIQTNRDIANLEANKAAQAEAGSQSSYASAARGMQALAAQYAQNRTPDTSDPNALRTQRYNPVTGQWEVIR